MKKTCFVVGPIGEEGSDTRQRADALLDYIIKKVLEAPPFEMDVRRADEIQKPGLITQHIIERVVNADLVVADLTDHNANAFYELALRHVAQKPVVHLVLRGQDIPFDIKHQRTIFYDTKDLAVAERAKEALREHAEAVLNNPEAADNPISAALLVLDLAKSKSTTDQSLARVMKEVIELREDVRVVQNAVAPFSSAYANRLRLRDDNVTANLGLGGIGTDGIRREAAKKLGGIFGLLDTPSCAQCGQPIVGPVGQRSSDSAPIHWEGKCPPRPGPESDTTTA